MNMHKRIIYSFKRPAIRRASWRATFVIYYKIIHINMNQLGEPNYE